MISFHHIDLAVHQVLIIVHISVLAVVWVAFLADPFSTLIQDSLNSGLISSYHWLGDRSWLSDRSSKNAGREESNDAEGVLGEVHVERLEISEAEKWLC